MNQKQYEVTFTVSECSEFHNFGEYHEGIATAEEALKVFHSIPPQRLHATPAIGINVHEVGTKEYQDDQIDILTRTGFDLEVLGYVPYLPEIEQFTENLAQLLYRAEEYKINGEIPEAVADRLQAIKYENISQTEKLARDIDQFSKEYDSDAYNDRVDDVRENIQMISQSIESGETGYLKEWLDEVMVEDNLKDIRRQAHQLRMRLEQADRRMEYKPLAKVEELEEGNYTRIDGLIDTSDRHQKEEKQHKDKCISIRQKLAEKKEQIERQRKCNAAKEGQHGR